MRNPHGPLRVGIGGPVGSGKTALMDLLCKKLRDRFEIAAITNDIYTKWDAEYLVRSGALSADRIAGVETGGCPHTAIREDASINLAAVAEMRAKFPDLDLVLIESGGDNLAATFSPELADLTIYVIDVAAGDKIPSKGGPGITRSDLLVINKVDLAPYVGASLEVMERDAKKMRGTRPFVFTNLREGKGVDEIAKFIVDKGGLELMTARERLEQALSRIDDPGGEGARTCLTIYHDQARAAAEAADARARAGISLGPLDGTIVSIKDLFDVAGEVTRAGSKVLAEEGKPATADAPVVQRLRKAGAVIVAKTNMSEFAFTGIGINPHFGTPGNPADRVRVPGGSSSGAAVSAADGMCEIAIGSDTGGSCRVPAALCGVVGFKPSRQRIPTAGAFPLSYSLDSIGSLSKTVAGCALADAVMAGEEPSAPDAAPLAGLRLGVAQGMPLENLDDTVGKRFPAALGRLEKAGARLSNEKLPLIDDMMRLLARVSILVAEAYCIHRDRLARRGADFDQIVRGRTEKGRNISAADYIETVRARAGLMQAMDARLADLDVLAMPATATIAPRIDEVGEPKAFMARNALLVAQHHHRQLLRSHRHLVAFAARRRLAGRPDADCA